MAPAIQAGGGVQRRAPALRPRRQLPAKNRLRGVGWGWGVCKGALLACAHLNEFGSLDPMGLTGLRLAGIGRSTYDVRQ